MKSAKFLTLLFAISTLFLFGAFACSSDDKEGEGDGEKSGDKDAAKDDDDDNDSGKTDDDDNDDDDSTELPEQSDCEPNEDDFPVRPEPSEPATLSFLRVEGLDILNEENEKVALRGINFGSWLMMETWIAGIGLYGEREFLKLMDEKAKEFGVERIFEEAKKVNALSFTAYQQPRWISVMEWREKSYELIRSEEDEENLDKFWAWFDEEPWIFEERMLWNYFTKRFGKEKSDELRETFQDNYITELDVENFAGLGLNLIRLPVWYDALETDYKEGNHFKPYGWQKMDQLVNWARKHKVYVMIDLHGAPGGQSPWWHQGLENGGFHFKDQRCIDKTARLWKAIAQYFKDEPHVAVLDLLNEPNSPKNQEEYINAHDAYYRAIREVNTKHIIMAEDGFMAKNKIASPKEMGWENAMFSFHFYPGGGSAEGHLRNMDGSAKDLSKVFDRFECPLFAGEFNVYGPTDFNATDDPNNRWQPKGMEMVLDMFNKRGMHWAPWTWKYFASPSMWGVYYPKAEYQGRIDVKDATFEEIKARFEKFHSQYFEVDKEYEAALKKVSQGEFADIYFGDL